MHSQVTQMSGTLRDNKVVTQIKTMQAKYLIDEKSELQTQLQDRDQRLKIISVENSQVATTTALVMICDMLLVVPPLIFVYPYA